MTIKRDKYGNLIEPTMPGEVDKSAVNNAWQGVTAAKSALDNMSYDNFKQGSVYQGLKKDYSQQGQQAMKDTIGQVAARTGGMASSYATSAANQSYNNYMRQLEDVARSMYNDEYSRARDKVDLAQREYDTAYGEYRDSYNDAWDRYNADMQAYQYGVEEDKYNKGIKDAELEAMFGAKGFDWDNYDWNGDGQIDQNDSSAQFDFSGSSHDMDYWKAYADNAKAGYDEEDRTAAEEEVIEILKAGGEPSNDLLIKAGLLDKITSTDESKEPNYDTDGDGIPNGLQSALVQTLWENNNKAKSDKTMASAVADIEARIANGESLDTIADAYEIGEGQKTWEDVTGMSEAEWTKKYNDNTMKNYSYKDTNAGRNEIVDTMINSRNLSLTAKDQNNFDYLFGNGAYKAVQNFIRAVGHINGADDQEIERSWDEYQREEDILVSITSLTVDQIENILKAANPYLFESLFPKER